MKEGTKRRDSFPCCWLMLSFFLCPLVLSLVDCSVDGSQIAPLGGVLPRCTSLTELESVFISNLRPWSWAAPGSVALTSVCCSSQFVPQQTGSRRSRVPVFPAAPAAEPHLPQVSSLTPPPPAGSKRLWLELTQTLLCCSVGLKESCVCVLEEFCQVLPWTRALHGLKWETDFYFEGAALNGYN